MIPIFIDDSSFAVRDRDDTRQHQDSLDAPARELAQGERL
jgi:hypothetical protein